MGCDFKIERGQKVVDFVEKYVVPTRGFGADKPTKLLPWQRDDFFIPLFSWIKPNGYRLKREAFLGCPRQNGKSFVGTATCVYMLVADDEAGPDILLMGTTQDQVKRVLFSEVLKTVTSNKKLLEVLEPRPSTYEIHYPARNGRIKGCSSEGLGRLGSPLHFACLDEFCFWQDYGPYVSIKEGTGSRNQSLILYTSTSGTDRTTPAYSAWQYAAAILDNACDDPTFFPLIYSAKPEEPIAEKKTWLKCNPTAPHSPTLLEEIGQRAERAAKSKIDDLHFRQYRLNQWCSSVNQFLDLDAFHKCGVSAWPELTSDMFCGVDLATTTDLCSVVGVQIHEGKYYVTHHSFCCREGVKKADAQNLQKYSVFESEKVLTVHDGNCIDFEQVRDYIRSLCEKHTVKAIAFDPSHNAADTMLMLKSEGLPVEQYRQGPLFFNAPMRRLNELVLDQKLCHRGDALILWEAQNLEAKKDHRDMLVPHKANDANKIDIFIGLCMALSKTVQNVAEQANGDTGLIWW